MFTSSPRKFHSLLILPALLSLLFLVSARVPDNHPPVAVDDSYTVHGGADLDLRANDSDPDGDPLMVTAFSQAPAHGRIYRFGIDGIGYSADYGYVGSDSFTYTVCDGAGGCDDASVNLEVVNQPPVGQTDEYIVHGGRIIGSFLLNDSDPEGDPITLGDTLHEGIVTFPQHGTLEGINQPGQKFYTANYGYVGPDSFIYRVCDAFGACSTASVSLTVENNPPVAVAHQYEVHRGSATIGPLLLGDFDPDESDIITMGGIFQESIVVPPEHGVLAGLTQPDMKDYFPNQGFAGTDSFVYAICDNLGACSTATVTLHVMGNGTQDGVCDPCMGAVGGPINVTNGNMYLQQNDYSLPAIGPMVNVTRTFNSDSQGAGLFGSGWSTAYDQSITAYDSYTTRFNQADGRAIYFGRPVGSAGAFAPLVGDFHGALTQGAGGFTLTMKDGSVEQFNSSGRLLSMADRNGNQTSLGYDTNGKLVSITDPFGRVLTLTTNVNGQVLSISDSLGTIATYTYGGSNELLSVTYADNSGFTFAYDGALRLTTVTDALGSTVESHSYDGQGRALISEKQGGIDHYSLSYVSDTETDVTDGLGRITKYTFDTSKGRNVVTRVEGLCSCGGGGGSQVQTWTYDNQLNVTSKTDALGHVTSYTYDGNGNRLTETDPTGTVTYTYNGFAEVLTRTDQLNNVTTNAYDANGNLLTTTNALGKTITFTYDPRGLLQTVTDARGKVTTFTYDAGGNLITRTDALSNSTQFAYDARGRLTGTTNALGFVTAFGYDAFGRLNLVTQADSTTITYEYDLAGRRTAMTDAKGNRSTFAYDSAYRLTSQTDAANQTTSYGYDAMSNLTSVMDALSRATNYDYDEFNRLVKITYPPATTGATRLFETLTYNAGGNVTQRADTAGRVTSYAYDDVNRVISTTDAASQTTNFEYDPLSRMTALVDAINQRYRFNYDAVGQLKHVRRGTDVMSFTYDPVGNRKTRTDYNGALTDYTYDALNRLKTISYPDTTTVSYTYDRLSRLQTATNENGTVNFDYNRMNRLIRATDVFGQVVEYNYDPNGNRTKLGLNAATVATYRYDPVDRLTRILDVASLATNYSYDATNKLTSRRLPNGVLTTYQYDGMDRLTRLLDAKGVATLADHQYQYNPASQITQIAEPTITRSYGYDTVDRLTSANYTNPLQPNENYAYDGVGNRTSSHLSASYSYQRFNRLTSTSTATYSYDLNGNLISKTDVSGTTQFQWDFENRLRQVTLPNASIVSYKYDALGRRIQRTQSTGVSTNFVYDGQEVLKDLNSDGSTVDYLNGPGLDNKLRFTDSRLTALGPLYFLQDHHGSTTNLTNSLGLSVTQVTYDAFGNSSGSSFSRYDYTGRERDADTGLMYYRARWYDPQVGRFVSEDPIGFSAGQTNLLTYVGNNPANSVDPNGLWERRVHIRIINEAFKCLNAAGLERLENSNDEVDGLLNGGAWFEKYSYQHGMRAPWETVDEARKKADDWINEHMAKARALSPNGCRFGANNIPGKALEEFGLALHTIMDMTSPSHAGFQVWHGLPYPTGITLLDLYNYRKWKKEVYDPHAAQETLEVFESDPVRRKNIIDAARDAFKKAFGDCCCTR